DDLEPLRQLGRCRGGGQHRMNTISALLHGDCVLGEGDLCTAERLGGPDVSILAVQASEFTQRERRDVAVGMRDESVIGRGGAPIAQKALDDAVGAENVFAAKLALAEK